MEVQFKTRSIELERRHIASARARVRTSLRRFSSAIDHVSITVRDINGPRGGIDTECTVRVMGRAGWTVLVADTSDTVQSALGTSLARAKRTVARRVERAANFDRGELRLAGGSR